MVALGLILLWLHLGALALGGAATFGLPAVAMQVDGATPEARASLVAAMMRLGKMGGAAIGVLILTGLALIWTRYDGIAAMTVWFWVKMVLVAGFITLIALSRRNAEKAIAGNKAAADRQQQFALGGMAMVLTIVACAVLAFD